MNIRKLATVFFSPTGSTKSIISSMADCIPLEIHTHDITSMTSRNTTLDFKSDDLVIFGTPVYGGRVPALCAQTFKNMHGDSTPAIIVATYGNREYDDALLEMKTIAEACGFIVFAAAAFITEHSIMHSVAKGRPDSSDTAIILDFANQAWSKLSAAANPAALAAIELPGNSIFKEYGGIPLKPRASRACIKCGACARHCPSGAISANTPSHTNKAQCISCMSCIKICPTHARKLNKVMLSLAETAFAAKNSARREPELFL